MKKLKEIEPEYLRSNEVLQLLRIGSTTLYRWIDSGDFPKGVKFGRHRMWKAATVRKWIAKQAAVAD